jgi:adenosylcobinamide kinase/adenosylcobinamide-phosphate guanylyltransferase
LLLKVKSSPMASRRILVTGGTRSGKSRYAEGLLTTAPAVTYLAPGSRPDPAVDAEWANRVAAHRARRPANWTTVETDDLAGAVRAAGQPVLIDSLGSWLTAVLDRLEAWTAPAEAWTQTFDDELENLADAWLSCQQPAIAVTNEVGWGLVSEHHSGRVFTDLLGTVNSTIAQVSDQVVLMVAGRPLRLP